MLWNDTIDHHHQEPLQKGGKVINVHIHACSACIYVLLCIWICIFMSIGLGRVLPGHFGSGQVGWGLVNTEHNLVYLVFRFGLHQDHITSWII